MIRMPARTVVAMLLFAGDAAAQTGFRGDEVDGRDFDYSQRYFMDVFSYRLPPELVDRHEEASTGYAGTAGSISRDDLFVFQDAKLGLPLHERLHLRFQFLQAEDFDSRFQQHRLELHVKIADWIDAGPLIQVDPRKAKIDYGAGVTVRREDASYLSVLYLLEDAALNRKGGQGEPEFRQHPGTIGLRSGVTIGERWTANAHAFSILPLVQRFDEPDFDFAFRKSNAGFRLRGPLDPSRTLRLSVDGELSRKAKDFEAEGDPGEERLKRRALAALAEIEQQLGDGLAARGGLRYFGFREDNRFPNDVPRTRLLRRREHLIFAGVRLPVLENDVFVDPTLFVNVVDNAERRRVRAGRHNREGQVKLALPAEWRLSANASFVLNPTFYLDTAKFGGGNVQLVATF